MKLNLHFHLQIRRNLAATGHTPDDLRMAMASVVEQASRRPLTSDTNNTSGGNSNNMNQIFLEHMNANRDRRLGRGAGDGGAHSNRVRHPAGNGSGRASPYYAPPHDIEDNGYSGSTRGSPAMVHADGLTADYGVFNQHHHGHHIEEDRRSHGSGRSGRSQGHRNPSPRPHSFRGDNPMAYTYYGNVDEPTPAPDPAVTASAPSYEDVVTVSPPPSYEEAATGKYDPRPM
ncbi:hypothetical protein ElyMa_000270600 [Elysia marginata]|uniref:Uncharacterized protein n=1 Tax=Elysia marginata TaxID=1093978 RepID=A0AAV4F4K1_9GAST|nr:hypothetical protein ElyMa_000270600 [Elysia marginata]